jgi:hypothetical protein
MRNRILNIKTKVSMTDVLSHLSLLPFTGAAEEFQMRCPFHGQDTKPSSRVYRNELFKCFACGVAYDVIDFFAEYKKVNKKDACYLLEKEFGIQWNYADSETSVEPVHRPITTPTCRDIPIADLVRITEKQIIEIKYDLGLERYSKSLYVLDRAEETDDLLMIKSLRSKIGLKDASKRHI